MSGSISAPMGNAPMAAGVQPGMGGQMPPQLLAMLLQAAQRQQDGPAQMQSAGPMQPAMGGPAQAQMPQPPQPMASPQAMGAPAPQQPPMPPEQQIPGPMPGGMSNTYGGGNPAAKGRFGDSMMAHMTPGEIAVPPQVQTPQLLSALQSAFKQAGVSPQQFTAGSPFASQNPQTGNQEFSLWSAILPVLGAVGGSFIPGIGTAAGAALGGGLGGAAGGAIDKTGVGGILGGAAGGAAGGYLGGGGGLSSLFGSGASGAGAAASGAAGAAGTAPLGAANAASAAGSGLFDGPPVVTPGSQGIVPGGNLPLGASPTSPGWGQLLKTGLGAGLGSTLGSGLGQSFNSAPSALPPGFSNPMPAPNPNMPIAGRTAGQMPTFTGYNPYAAVTGGGGTYNFYPTT